MTLDPFEFQFVFPPLLQQLTPVNAVYETGTFTNSGDGDVTGNVIPVDINLTPPRAHRPVAARRRTSPVWTSADPTISRLSSAVGR